MSECRASKRAKKNNVLYNSHQMNITIPEADRIETTNKLNKYLIQRYGKTKMPEQYHP